MDFDHRDPKQKQFRITEGAAMLRNRESVLAEIEKCDIVCANCHRIRTWERHKSRAAQPDGTSRYLETRRRAWRAHAERLNELRRVACADCGREYPPCAMDFDHRQGTYKISAVTRMVGRSGIARILAEVGKCDIVCANCHRARTFVRRQQHRGRE